MTATGLSYLKRMKRLMTFSEIVRRLEEKESMIKSIFLLMILTLFTEAKWRFLTQEELIKC